MEKEQMAEAILKHTMEIISLLTVEDYMVVKRLIGGKQCTYSISASEPNSDSKSSSTKHQSISFTLLGMEERNQKKILELANKIIQILTSEVPIKCDDVAMYFSLDEWEYLEGHLEQYNQNKTIQRKGRPLAPPNQRKEHEVYLQRHIKEEPDSREYTGGTLWPSSSCNPENLETHPAVTDDDAQLPMLKSQVDTSCGSVSPGYIKLENIESYDENTMDDSPGSSQFLLPPEPDYGCNIFRQIKEEPDESDSQESALDTHINQGSSQSPDPDCDYNIIKYIKEETEESDSKESVLETHIDTDHELSNGDEVVRAESAYKLTDTKKRSRKSKAGGRSSPCDMCGKKFGSKASLARHVKTHTGDRPFPCPVCGKRFACKKYVATHERIHTGERPFSCKLCSRKFINNAHLVLHQVVHTGEKPFSCPDCGKCFTRQSSVKKHIVIHAEKKPFVCQECGKSYCQYANLVVHQRLHSGEKPYTCKHCGRGFICKATMQRHELTHTKERPFPCNKCSKCFRDNSTLMKHKRKAHAKD